MIFSFILVTLMCSWGGGGGGGGGGYCKEKLDASHTSGLKG